MNQNTVRARRYRQKKIDEYLSKHGNPPLCGCGCGGFVRFNANGVPNTYINNHHPPSMMKEANTVRLSDCIDVDPFRDVLRKLKKQRQWTWAQLAEAGGVGERHLSSLMYGPQKRVSRDWARDFLTRLAGGAAPPSTYHKNQLALSSKAKREVVRMYEETLT